MVAVHDWRPYFSIRQFAVNPTLRNPIRNVNLTSLPIDRIVLILKAELFMRTTGAG